MSFAFLEETERVIDLDLLYFGVDVTLYPDLDEFGQAEFGGGSPVTLRAVEIPPNHLETGTPAQYGGIYTKASLFAVPPKEGDQVSLHGIVHEVIDIRKPHDGPIHLVLKKI